MSKDKINGDAVNDSALVVKKKRFKKSDVLVMIICLVAALLIWVYATSLEKAKKEEAKDDIKDALKETEVVESAQ